MAQANRLNQRKLNRIFTDAKPGVFGDGHGLFLRLRGNCTSGQWIQILHVDGKRTERGLGGYPIVSLDEARETAFANRRMARRGQNPWVEKQTIKSKVPTFADGLEAVIAIKRPSWKGAGSENQWRASIRDHAASLQPMRVDEIRTKDVLGVLEPIWHSKHETADRVKNRAEQIMNWAIAKGYREDNPVSALNAVLPKSAGSAKHYAALPYAQVPAAMAKISKAKGYVGTNLALRFLILTATRSAETRGANWNELSTDGLTWTIPSERMKSGKEHVIPLSEAALAVLDKAEYEFGQDGLIFPSVMNKTPSPDKISKLLQQCGINAVPHGFRSSFRDWSAEHGYDRDVAEAALAHKVRDQVEAAYRRTDFLEKRRTMMEQWGAFCTGK